MADTATFDFIFEPAEKISRGELLQGDLLHRTPELRDAIGQAHSYYATSPDYSHFLVLTQSCDLVRRKGSCKSRYVTICAVRPLALAVERELARYTVPVKGCPIPVGNLADNVLARQFLERVVNNTVDGMFFIPKGSAVTVDRHLCAFLPLSVALRADHYDILLKAKVAQTKEIFAAKVGSLASNLYSRIATPDLHERNDPAAVKEYMKAFFQDLGYASVTWLSPFQRKAFQAQIIDSLTESGNDSLSEAEAEAMLKRLPKEADAIADRVVAVLAARKLLGDDEETQRKARNFILNDSQYRQLADR